MPGILEAAASRPNKPLLMLCAPPPPLLFVSFLSGVGGGAAAAASAAQVGRPNNDGTAGVFGAESNKPPPPLPNPLELLPPKPADADAPEDWPHEKADGAPVAVGVAAAPAPNIDPVVAEKSPRVDGRPKRGVEIGRVEFGAAARCTSVPSLLSCPQLEMTTCSFTENDRKKDERNHKTKKQEKRNGLVS